MTELGIASFESYADHIRLHPEEGERLPDIMHITVTRFYRDATCWEGLGRVMPGLAASGRKVRFLSAGCCGGEEPYTLAIAWKELFEERFGPADILAVDMDEAGLERARKAVYDKRSLRELPDAWRERWFIASGRRLHLSPEIMSMVRFERLHLVNDALPGSFDLIMCRNLFFTYFTEDRRFRAALVLWEALRPGGALMIGEKEGLGPRELDIFTPWPGARCFFRRAA